MSGESRSAFPLTVRFEPLARVDSPVSPGTFEDAKEDMSHISFRGRTSVMPSDPGIDWSGDQDMSADVYFGWDNDNLVSAAGKA